MKFNGRTILFTALLVIIATISKLLFAAQLAWSGFSPIIAIALFSGMIVKDKSISFLYPLIALLLSDVIIEILYQTGNFAFKGLYKYQWLNYGFLLFAVLIGWILNGKNYTRIFAGALVAPTVFFLISNFTVWMGHGGYYRPFTFEGLIQCYADGLPFYKHSIAATLIYLPAVILSYNAIMKRNYRLVLA